MRGSRRYANTWLAILGALLLLPSAALPPAEASDAQFKIDEMWTSVASSVVEGTIIEVSPSKIGGLTREVITVQVDSWLKGAGGDVVRIVQRGGIGPDGTAVQVSHQPGFIVGDVVQVALKPLGEAVRAPLAENLDVPPGTLVEVVGTEHGVVWLSGSKKHQIDVLGTTTGASDYTFTGFSYSSFSPPPTYQINTADSGMSNSEAIGAINRAMQRWENLSDSGVDFVYEGTTGRKGGVGDGYNVIYFSHLPTKGFLAQATISSRGGDPQWDIVVNTAWPYRVGAAPGSFDLETVMIHEIGHILGLGHTLAKPEVMYPTIVAGQSKGIGAGDRAGVRHLYPANMDPRYCDGVAVTVYLELGQRPSNGNDVIWGTTGPDTIDGLGGNDIICGRGGNDVIDGGIGADRIFGGAGNDSLSGGAGDDYIKGQDGNDVVRGETGHDRVFGNNGNDDIAGGDGNDYVSGNRDSDRLVGGDGNDTINGGSHADHMRGGAGDDVMNGNGGPDDMAGGTGNDEMSGGDANDKVSGEVGHDIVNGNRGDDLVWGGSGGDKLFGQTGNDTLIGGDGNDALDGNDGTDTCDGRAGNDTAVNCAKESSVEQS